MEAAVLRHFALRPVWRLHDSFSDARNSTSAGSDACATSAMVGPAFVGQASQPATALGRGPLCSLFRETTLVTLSSRRGTSSTTKAAFDFAEVRCRPPFAHDCHTVEPDICLGARCVRCLLRREKRCSFRPYCPDRVDDRRITGWSEAGRAASSFGQGNLLQ